DGQHPAVVQPDPAALEEPRAAADAVAAVAGEQGRVLAVEGRPLAADDGERHPGAVPRGREDRHYLAVVERDRRLLDQRGPVRSAGGAALAVIRRRLEVAA